MHWIRRKTGPLHFLTIIIAIGCLTYGFGLGLSRGFEALVLTAVAGWAFFVAALVELALRIWPTAKPVDPNQNDAR